MENELRSKLGRIFSGVKGVDAIALVNSPDTDPNFLYVTGYTSGLFEGDVLIITKSEAYHLTSMLEYGTAMAQKVDGLSVINVRSRKEAQDTIGKLVRGKRLGLNEEFLPYAVCTRFKARYKPGKVVDVSSQLAKTRMVKGEKEISRMRKAVNITKWALMEIQKHFAEGTSEKELAADFDYIMMRLGAQKPAFDTIVCFGKNAALPHHMPDSTKLKNGDFILIDAGARVDNYCADITRTFAFGNRSAKMKEVYDIVKDARMLAIKAVKPGAKGKAIHRIAEDCINKSAKGRYKGRFIHALGHSLGIEVHDGEGFSPKSELVLKPGMVITVEPGVYVEGFGGVRIEDDVLVTREGHIVL